MIARDTDDEADGAKAPPSRRSWTKLCGDLRGPPSQIRLDDDGDLMTLVDEQVTSRARSRAGAGVNGRVYLTLAEAVWLRNALAKAIDARTAEAS